MSLHFSGPSVSVPTSPHHEQVPRAEVESPAGWLCGRKVDEIDDPTGSPLALAVRAGGTCCTLSLVSGEGGEVGSVLRGMVASPHLFLPLLRGPPRESPPTPRLPPFRAQHSGRRKLSEGERLSSTPDEQ